MARDEGRRRSRDDREERDSEFIDKLVHINRVAKVVKGGRRFGFAALVVVGDEKGRVGFGHGKAREVPEAIRKATDAAKRGLIRVPLREGRTLHHDVAGRHGAGKVYLRAAPPGTGIIAGGPMRAVFETLGMQHVLADRPGARKKRTRIGRGIGSGTGKTGGRGGKGQTARSGVRIKGFEGGQMPLHRRLPKRGFRNTAFARKLNEVNLGVVQTAIDAGKLDTAATVDAAALVKAGVLRREKGGVRLLGHGAIK